MDTQVGYVKQRFENYLAQITAISESVPPPGKNAANGWFREGMLSDPTILAAGSPPTLELSGDALKLYDIYTFFYSMSQRAFTPANYKASWGTNMPVLWQNLDEIKAQVIAVVSAFFDLISGSEEEQDKAEQDLATSIKALVDKVNSSGVVGSGTHANGWISVYARDGANATLGRLDAEFPPGLTTDAGKVAGIVRAVCIQIAGLPTQSHKPWLRAEWQVKFQGICDAASTALASYK